MQSPCNNSVTASSLRAWASVQVLLEVEHAKQLLELERSYLEKKTALESRHRHELKTLDGEQTLLAESIFSLSLQIPKQPGLITSGGQQCQSTKQLFPAGRDQSQELACETPAAPQAEASFQKPAHSEASSSQKSGHPFRPVFAGSSLKQVSGNKGSVSPVAASPSRRLEEDAPDALPFGANLRQGLEDSGVTRTQRAAAEDSPKHLQPATDATEDTYYVVSTPLCRTHTRKGDPTREGAA